jgi:hypothetical protein
MATNFIIESENTVISNCGQYNLLISGGGRYIFNHATIANYWPDGVRQTPAVFAQNYYLDINGTTQIRNIDSLNFKNSIIYGNIDNEFATDIQVGTLNYAFYYSLIKTTASLSGNVGNNIQNPGNTSIFADPTLHNYHLSWDSPAQNAGIISSVTLDKDGVTRNNPPDIGAYEY